MQDDAEIEYCFAARKFEFNDPPGINNSTFDLSERFGFETSVEDDANVTSRSKRERKKEEKGEKERERDSLITRMRSGILCLLFYSSVICARLGLNRRLKLRRPALYTQSL